MRVLEQVLKGEPVFIKNTGISVTVLNFDWHKENRNRPFCVQIHFEGTPSREAIKLCDHFRIRTDKFRPNKNNTLGSISVNPPPPVHVDVEAHISVDELSDIPYETKAARTLYKKQK